MLIQKLLENFARFNLKQCQEIVDAIFGPEYDNSNVPIVMPSSIQAHCYGYINAITYLDSSWSTSAMNRGDMGIVAEYNVSCYNGVLTFSEPSFIGRDYDTNWTGTYVEPMADECERQLKAVLAGGVYQYYMYPEWAVFPRYTSATNVLMSQKSSGGVTSGDWIYSRMKKYNSESYYQTHYVNLAFTPVTITDKGGGYVQASTRGFIPASYAVAATNSAGFITRCNNTTFINRYITDSGSEHNYTYNYTTKNGDAVTVYYGDNYVIFNASDTAKINYNEQKDILDRVANQINIDTGSDIKIPTYEEVKYGPIPPAPEEDDIDKQDMGVGTNLGGLSGYWLLTKAQLADLHGVLDSAPVGFDPLNSFISLMGLGVDASKVLDATQFQYVTPINIRMSDGTTWQTHVEAHIISSDEIVSAFNSDTFRIQRKYNNFLDYSPYATHELFIPMCGWVTLPDIAVDRDIYVTYIPDIESCKCRAVVSVVSNSEGNNNACVIAEKDGIMGSDVPFSNVGHSLYVGDAIINGANVAGEIITGAIGAGFTKSNAKGGTYRPYEGFTVGMGGTLPGAIGNALVSGNINRTHFMTGNGTKTGFSDGESIIVKSVYHIPDMPDNYAHTVGLVCNKTGQLSEFNGFTVCDNPHITFSALEAEKEEIKRLLEEGVILPSGE